MADEKSFYQKLGIDPKKSIIKQIFGKIIDNDYVGAFVNIVKSLTRSGIVVTKHSDGDGSKSIQRNLNWLETGDETYFDGAIDDAMGMNTGDTSASGFVDCELEITDVIDVNSENVPKEMMLKRFAIRFAQLFELYKKYGFKVTFYGGETADLLDQVQTVTLNVDVRAETKKENVIKGNVQPGDKICGFASDGKAKWEKKENSGIMSNGLTMARVVLMSFVYNILYPFLIRNNKTLWNIFRKFYKSGYAEDKESIKRFFEERPELIQEAKDNGLYHGKYEPTDTHPYLGEMTIGEALTSPTRQWAFVIKILMDELKKRDALHMLHGISMNTGGGATKISNVGKGIVYHKTIRFIPGIFRLIQEESREGWRGMFQSFNCGVGIDVVGSNDPAFYSALAATEKETGIRLYDLGHCEANPDSSEKNVVKITSIDGSYTYE